MTATSPDGKRGNIIPRLPAGAVVTGVRGDTDIIVTEHGVADLRHRDVEQKAQALIGVAAPEFREELARSWRDGG